MGSQKDSAGFAERAQLDINPASRTIGKIVKFGNVHFPSRDQAMPFRQFCLLMPFLVCLCACNKENKQDGASPASGGGNGAGDDNQAIQGKWRCVQFEEEGTNAPPGKLDDVFYVFEGDKLKVVFQDMTVAEGSYKLDPKAVPKSIDLPEQPGQKDGVGLGIYQLDGDNLTICARAFVRKDSERPRQFASAANSNTILMKFERDKR